VRRLQGVHCCLVLFISLRVELEGLGVKVEGPGIGVWEFKVQFKVQGLGVGGWGLGV
jgi:hypothetical protein